MKSMTVGRFLRISISMLLLSLAAALPANAQVSTGQISGTVKDASGAPLPGVTILVINEQTSLQRSATADNDGYYLVSNLPPGSYSVRVEQNGFKTFVRGKIQLTAGDRMDVSPEMQIGALSETVTVFAEGGQVQTESGTVEQLIDGSQVRDLALNGRNLTQLLMTVPGVAATTDTFDRGAIAFGNLADFTVNGMRATSNAVTVDGGSNQDSGSTVSQTNNVSVDFVSAVKIASSGYSAQYGRYAGAQVNVATRSGTENFHGTLFEFFRNDKLNARSFFAPRIEKLNLNNFGWNLSGPVTIPGHFNSDRKKVFFFGGQEYKRRVDGETRRVQMPTREQRAGIIPTTTVLRYPSNFSVDALRGQQIADPSRATAANPQGLNILPLQYQTANGRAIMKIFDTMEARAVLFNDSNVANNTTFQETNRDIRRQDILRLDYQPSNQNQFLFRYLYDPGTNSVPYETGSIPAFQAARTNRARNIQVAWTSVLSEKTVNEAAVVSVYLFFERIPFGDTRFPRTYGLAIKELYGDEMNIYGIPTIAIAGVTTIGGARANPHSPSWDFSVRDNLSHLVGKHNLKVGGLFIRNRKNERANVTLTGSVSYSPSGNQYSTGNAILDSLLGNYRQYSETDVDKFNYIRFTQFEGYVADTWKVQKNLTLDIGVRYYFMTPPYTTDNLISTFQPSLFDPARAQQVIPSGTGVGELRPGVGQPYNGVVVAGSEFPFSNLAPQDPRAQNLFGGLSRGFYENQHKVSPRFGFAWDPTGKAHFSVRGGGAIYYDRLPVGDLANAGANPPFVNTITLFDGTVENLSRGRNASFPVGITSFRPDVRSQDTYNWNLGFQKKLPFNTLLDVNYVSTQGRHLLRRPNINQVLPNVQAANPGININALRPYSGYTDINLYESSASSSYHGLQTGFTRRFSSDITFSVAYTWSKVLTDASDKNNGVENILNYRRERSHATFDRNHIFVATYVYKFPFFRSKAGLAGKVLGGWELSGITQFQSGAWLSPSINTPTGSRRPNLVGELSYFDPRQIQTLTGGNGQTTTGNFYFDPTPGKVFTAPAADQFGNAAPFIILGPGRNNWDMSLFKNLKFYERVNLQFRAEFFNVWNHANFRNPNTNASDINFGTISDAGPPRLVQFGLKLLF